MHDDALSVLVRMSKELLDGRSLEDGLATVADTALSLLAADHASVRLLEDDATLRPTARAGIGSDRPAPLFRAGEGVLGWVASTGHVARVADGTRDARFVLHPERGYEIASVLSVPLLSTGKVLGVLSASASRAGAFDDRDEHLAVLLANSAAQLVRTANLEQLAITDVHTLAYNRRYLFPRLAEEMQRARRTGERLSVLLMDLDHFKRVNDAHGHSGGDALLRGFADVVRATVRSVDLLVRRGGEEFVLIMPHTDRAEARRVADRIRTRLHAAPLRVRDGVVHSQTVSIGVATWDGEESAEELDERADLAMYEAKRLGRDQVVSADSMIVPITVPCLDRHYRI